MAGRNLRFREIQESLITLCEGGFEKAWEKLEKNYLDFDGFEVWTAASSVIVSASDDPAASDSEKLKTVGLAKEATGFGGKPIPEYLFENRVGDVKSLNGFLNCRRF